MENLKKISENTVSKYSLEKDGYTYDAEVTTYDNKLITLVCYIAIKTKGDSPLTTNKGFLNITTESRKCINVDMDVDVAVVGATFEEIIKAVTLTATAAVVNDATEKVE
ncbi:MAG: hypothetical protein H6Q12_16 [Bacteroidetes bacterium]|nr:hypothetical protein [Bacteroidota bacterium]